MRYATPFVTPRFTAYAGDRVEHKLSLAVSLVDEFTGQAPLGQFRVFIKGREAEMRRKQEPIRNLSGYYCFLDLDPGTYTVIVDPAPNSRIYALKPTTAGDPWPADIEQTFEVVAKPTDEQRLDPSLQILLSPDSTYPFPPFATLVRGRVTKRTEKTPAPFASLTSPYKQAAPTPDDPDARRDANAQASADADGYYTLAFKNPVPANEDDEEITVDITAKFKGAQKLISQLIHEGEPTSPVDITVP